MIHTDNTDRKRNAEKEHDFDKLKGLFTRLARRSGGTEVYEKEYPDKNSAAFVVEIGQLEVYGDKNMNDMRSVVGALDAFSIRPINNKKAAIGGRIDGIWEDGE